MWPGARMKINTALPAFFSPPPPSSGRTCVLAPKVLAANGVMQTGSTYFSEPAICHGGHTAKFKTKPQIFLFLFFFFYVFSPPFLYFLTLLGAVALSALNTAFLLPSMGHYGRGFIGSRTPRLYNGSSVQGKYCTICLHAVSSLPFPLDSPTHALASGLLKQDLKNQKNERFLISPLSPASEQDI